MYVTTLSKVFGSKVEWKRYLMAAAAEKKISDFIQSMAISSHRNCITNYSGGGFDKYSSKL